MKMKMLANTRAGGLPKVHTDVESLRAVQLLKPIDQALSQLHHFRHLFGFCQSNRVEMLVGSHHDVPRGIRKQIQNDEIVSAAKHNEPVHIVSWIVSDAKDTRLRLCRPRRQIIVAPGAPKKIHTM